MSGGYNSPGADAGATSARMQSVSSSSIDREESALGSAPIIGVDVKKHGELKNMLDSDKENLKLEAMKIIVGMVAKGKDCAALFPAVVKNVVTSNPEIKKLVYVYLMRYAEEQQDAALLSVSSFQKALKDPNQMIRAGALRILCGIRVPIIAPVMMLAIKESSTDMSPYVRKVAAHAIPKLYSLDPDMQESLVEIVEKLLKDKTTLVVGSVVMAFEAICPDRIDLIHKNYRKLVNLLADVDEWGQVSVINMLTRYARTQFVDPNLTETASEQFYSSSGSEDESEEDSEGSEGSEGKKKKKKKKRKPLVMDPDHRLLLRSVKPLLQSRNASVVMSVVQLYYHLAPQSEQGVVTKAFIRLLKGHREVQSVVLSNIAALSVERPATFDPFLKNFYVLSTDPTHIKMLKLEVLTNIANETNVHTVMREFRAYITFPDRAFAVATVQAIGRVACAISEVTETCLHGLMSLLSNKDENIVGESVVVIKKLLQMKPREHKDLIVQVSRMVDSLTVPMARASVLWMIGEYCNLVPKIAPDILRKAAKNFTNEDDIVKLQIVNLAAKLLVTNPKQTTLLCQYVLNLARYDLNYDVRDRVRFLRQLLMVDGSGEAEEGSALSKYAKKILLSSKPAPVLESPYKGRSQFQLGSLSYYINAQANGYIPLPDFPEEPPDSSVRDVDEDFESFFGKKKKKREKSFYSSSEEDEEDEEDEEESSEFYSEEDEGSEEEGESKEGSDEEEEEEESEEEEEGEEESSDDAQDVLKNLRKTFKKTTEESEEEEEDEEEEEETSSEEESTEEESEEEPPKKPAAKSTSKKKAPSSKTGAQDDLLLLFDDESSHVLLTAQPPAPLMPSMDNMLTPMTASMNINGGGGGAGGGVSYGRKYTVIPPVVVPTRKRELLNRITGQGLQACYRFTRRPHPYSESMLAVELEFSNTTDSAMGPISVGSPKLPMGMEMKAVGEIPQLPPGNSLSMTVGINFNDSLQLAKFDIRAAGKVFPVQVEPHVGELVQAVTVTPEAFTGLQGTLAGMCESQGKTPSSTSDKRSIEETVLSVANLGPVRGEATGSILRFAGVTFASQSVVLVTVESKEGNASITVNCEKMTIHSILLKELKEALAQI